MYVLSIIVKVTRIFRRKAHIFPAVGHNDPWGSLPASSSYEEAVVAVFHEKQMNKKETEKAEV